MIMGQIKLIVVMTTITQLQDFQDVMIFTDGGPAQATYVPGLVLYKSAFVYGKMGYASAIGLLLFIIVMLITLLNMRLIHSSTDYIADV
jgi:ABC-type sugar transport system permease subunit